jgi:DNA (cytosine-5)-methyltransferase 1
MSRPFISVCSGIEAASVAWGPLGWKAMAFSEIDAFPRAVLTHRYPDVPLFGDFTTIILEDLLGILGPLLLSRGGVLAGGTPCQSFSVAGLRKGLDDPRGNLMLAFLRLAELSRAEWLVWENVPGVLSVNGGRDFGAFLWALGQLGYGWSYRVLDAQHFGVPQRRRRVFVVGHLGDWRRAAAVLFERHSLSGHPAPRREAGKAAPTIPSRSTAGGGLGTDFDCDGGLDQAAIAEGSVAGCGEADLLPGMGHVPERATVDGAGRVAACLDASFGRLQGQSGQDARHGHSHLVVAGPGGEDLSHAVSARDAKGPCSNLAQATLVACAIPETVHTLRGDGFDASEDGTGRGTPLVPVASPVTAFAHQQGGSIGLHHSEEVALTGQRHQQQAVCFDSSLGSRGGGVSEDGTRPVLRRNMPPAVVLPFDTTQITSPGNVSNPQAGDTGHPLAAGAHAPAVAFTVSDQSNGFAWESEVAPCLQAHPQSESSNIQKGVRTGMAVRRLTPTECERLQAFPDGYTAIPWRGKPAEQCPDGPRYRALGNSWATVVPRWIGERIDLLETLLGIER